jgi:hypothetical protein
MCALPKTYEALEGDAGATVVVVLNDSKRSLTWSLVADRGSGWTVYPCTKHSPAAAQVIPSPGTFWRLATGSVSEHEAIEQSSLIGDQHLAPHLFKVVAVVR